MRPVLCVAIALALMCLLPACAPACPPGFGVQSFGFAGGCESGFQAFGAPVCGQQFVPQAFAFSAAPQFVAVPQFVIRERVVQQHRRFGLRGGVNVRVGH